MENNDLIEDFDADQIRLNATSLDYLEETAKWARFLSIVGFVFTGFMVIIAIGMGAFMSTALSGITGGSPISGLGITILYLLLALLYFVPTLYLFRYSKNTRIALKTNDEGVLTEAMGNMKSVFKFWGIFMAIMMGIYALMIVMGIVGGGIAAFM